MNEAQYHAVTGATFPAVHYCVRLPCSLPGMLPAVCAVYVQPRAAFILHEAALFAAILSKMSRLLCSLPRHAVRCIPAHLLCCTQEAALRAVL
jgi:hypothetical protein